MPAGTRGQDLQAFQKKTGEEPRYRSDHEQRAAHDERDRRDEVAHGVEEYRAERRHHNKASQVLFADGERLHQNQFPAVV